MGLPGSQRSIEQLVDAHYASLFRYAYRLSGSAADAEDLTQDTFCKAQMNWSQLREPTRTKAWLYSILRNTYLHRVREKKANLVVSLDGVGDVAEPPPEPLPEVEPAMLQEALNELPEVFRTPIILYYFEEFSYRDIADQMDLPIGTVMSRLSRAKTYLRTRLAPGPLSDAEPVAAGGAGERRQADGL